MKAFTTFHFPLIRAAVCVGALALACASTLWAIHKVNPGPENVEIKFKLPPPKPLSPEAELATFKIPAGFHAELVAAEPLVDTPVAISWDEKGRMFVCEMRGYMHDMEGKGEDQPLGRIVMLEDSHGDGKLDRRVFADGLIMPRAIACVNGGLLVGEPPTLWFMKDSKGDGVADIKEMVDDKFGARGGQPEHMANSPTRFLDNWFYCADHPARYKLKDGRFIIETAPVRGQWGLSQDDYGREFYNSNSDFLRANFIPEQYFQRNPNYPATAGSVVQVLKDQSCWPSHPTPGVNRGYEPEQLRGDGTLATCTATCGPGVYRGGIFPKGYAGNVFIPEPAGNLVKRVIIDEEDGVLNARNAYETLDFWTSTDERFRPVNASTGPDGALYVVDMYRGVIEHKAFLTYYLAANIKERNLQEPFNLGRIWRIVPDGVKPKAPKLPEEPAQLVEYLGDKNGWVRDTAQRVLVEKKDMTVAPALGALVKNGPNSLAKIHALWTLEGLARLTPDVISAALKDRDGKVRATAVRLSDRTQAAEVAKLLNDPSADVQIALGFHLSTFPETQDDAIVLARRSGGNPLVRDALLSGLRGRELEVLEALVADAGNPAPNEMLGALAQAVMNERRSARVKKLLELIVVEPANSPAQVAMLDGAAGIAKIDGRNPPKRKILYLDAEAPELAALAAKADAKAMPLVAGLDARIAWPGKPGVPPPPVVVPLTAQEQQLFDVGKTVYTTLCAACHQPTGTGMEGLAPPLVDSEWVLGKPDVLPRIVLHGLSGPVKVNGQSFNLEMPPLGPALNDEQIAGVLTYIRREWEHNASPISVASVASQRSQDKDRNRPWSSVELMPPPPKKTEKAAP